MGHHPTVQESLWVARHVPPPAPHPAVVLCMTAAERAGIAGIIYGSFVLLLLCRRIALARRRYGI